MCLFPYPVQVNRIYANYKVPNQNRYLLSNDFNMNKKKLIASLRKNIRHMQADICFLLSFKHDVTRRANETVPL